MRLYLAGKMTGVPLYNFPEFKRYAAELRADGCEVLSPAERDMQMGFDPSRTVEEQGFDMRAAWRSNLEMLLSCDGVAVIPGYETSAGTLEELKIARLLGLEVRFL